MQARELDPVTGVPPIPAMTSEAERQCYYRLTREAEGAVIEFGAWLGASTAYMAAAAREKGGKVHTYDKFETKKSHAKLVRQFRDKHGNGSEYPDAHSHFLANVGPLIKHIVVHNGRIEAERWGNEPIGLIVFDAPKRVKAISAVLTNFRKGIHEGTIMAWQDFCHFPSYEIPASLYRLRKHLEFTEAVLPGSTMVFRVKSRWKAEEVTREALTGWTPAEIEAAWEYWGCFVPQQKDLLFRCGQAMFLSDIGHTKEAVAVLDRVLSFNSPTVRDKWEYLRGARPDFFVRYRPLFDCVAAHEKVAA
jgi:hypothetical protein